MAVVLLFDFSSGNTNITLKPILEVLWGKIPVTEKFHPSVNKEPNSANVYLAATICVPVH